MWCFCIVKCANAVGKIRASVVRDNDDVLQNGTRCSVLMPTSVKKTGWSLPVKGECETANAWFTEPVKISEEAPL